ncbi:Os01g0921550 [Oryza sativa Japonica Group]|uniref:Os01g0921550 protein n=1 Tax=Oryza sativa subsp. japonica TaxID=39947 RepID=A0A0P0VC82_ORYSJ|nr:hypothetical protein EE612_007624 [Oryza sativa]BAS75943.1 Os01g0921550 [Oryza sativa Japonica Group]
MIRWRDRMSTASASVASEGISTTCAPSNVCGNDATGMASKQLLSRSRSLSCGWSRLSQMSSTLIPISASGLHRALPSGLSTTLSSPRHCSSFVLTSLLACIPDTSSSSTHAQCFLLLPRRHRDLSYVLPLQWLRARQVFRAPGLSLSHSPETTIAFQMGSIPPVGWAGRYFPPGPFRK